MTTTTQPICAEPTRAATAVPASQGRAVASWSPLPGGSRSTYCMPDGSLVGRAPGDTAERPVLEMVRPDALFERLGHHPKIGIGEGYVAGDWRAGPGTDLAAAPAARSPSG